MRIEKSQLRGQSFNCCNQDLGAYLSSFHPPVVLPHPDSVVHGEPGLLVTAAVPGLEALPPPVLDLTLLAPADLLLLGQETLAIAVSLHPPAPALSELRPVLLV